MRARDFKLNRSRNMRTQLYVSGGAILALFSLALYQWVTASNTHKDNPFLKQSEAIQDRIKQANVVPRKHHFEQSIDYAHQSIQGVRAVTALKQDSSRREPTPQEKEARRAAGLQTKKHVTAMDEETTHLPTIGLAGRVPAAAAERADPSHRSTSTGTQGRAANREAASLKAAAEGGEKVAAGGAREQDSALPLVEITRPARLLRLGAPKHVEPAKPTSEQAEAPRGGGSGGGKDTLMYTDMYKNGFTGSFVMNKAKYRSEDKGAPVRVAKYMFQCLEPSPPRGCDLEAAKRDPPRGRGWQRVARISKEFMQLHPDTDVVRAMPKFKSCSVVGNGGSLLLSAQGADIDANEAVIRFNGGITKGFERFVGRKTTIRLTNTQHMGFHETDDEMVLQHITMERAMDKLAEVKSKHPKLRIYATDGDFHQYVLDTMEEGAASNGFFGMVFAYEKCERVTIYGFHKGWKNGDATMEKTKYHYYDNIEPNESQTKRDDVETPRMWNFLRKHLDVFRFREGDLDRKLRTTDELPEE